ncbi:MAG: hypothetical protein JST00_40190 [Deltaproteobacteria bacterium]|nr:hypothetical protein [Deltaproteobacteria bacterium]
MGKSNRFVALGFVTLAVLAGAAACSSSSTAPPDSTSSGGSSSGSSGSSGGGSDGGDATASDGGNGQVPGCDLATVTGASKVTSTFAIYDPPASVPVATTGGAISGTYLVTKAKVFLPTATKGLADPAKSTGTVTGWAVFEGSRYRIKLDAALVINSVLGDRPQDIAVDSQGGFKVSGSTLSVDQACDGPDSGTSAAYTFSASGNTATLVVKTPVATFGDAYLEIEAAKK